MNYEGARVRRGQPLLEIYSPELVATQEEYLLALRNAKRLSNSADAQRLVDAARRRLAYWDISDDQIRKLEETGTPTKTLTLYAPGSGTVTMKNVVEGQQIAPGQTLMQLSDLSRLWLIVDVYEQDLSWARPGTEAHIELPYEPGRTIAGRVDYVYDDLNPDSRTARARVTVPNPGLQFKPGMYATVQLVGSHTEPLPVVPAEAVVRTGEKEIVILALGEGRFRPQPVRAGMQSGDRVQILHGLEGGERVVTSAQFLIDSEARLQSAIGSMVGAVESAPVQEATGGAGGPGSELREVGGRAQVVPISVSPTGYQPNQVTLTKGVPTELVFTRTESGGCTDNVQIPDLGVAATALPVGESVSLQVTPTETGTFTFACGMDMVKGSILVVAAG